LKLIKSNKLSKYKNLSHGFFGSKGGFSKGIYKSLNCGVGSNDYKSNITKNLNIVLKKIKSESKNIILPNQIHSNKFYFIGKKNIKKRIKCDALITNQKKIPIAVLTADCAPLMIYDIKKKVISVVHAGWKGAYKGIIINVINYLFNKGCKKKDIIAVIGPCISVKSYEVKKDFLKKFLKKNKRNLVFFKFIKKRIFFDLTKYIKYQLLKLGIKKIEIINKDTYKLKNTYFSARRSLVKKNNDYGRNISLIMIN
tara:strand:+ start:632 stop:1393 length:762 start_codon:yes stop_codon:yes gene_type:complete